MVSLFHYTACMVSAQHQKPWVSLNEAKPSRQWTPEMFFFENHGSQLAQSNIVSKHTRLIYNVIMVFANLHFDLYEKIRQEPHEPGNTHIDAAAIRLSCACNCWLDDAPKSSNANHSVMQRPLYAFAVKSISPVFLHTLSMHDVRQPRTQELTKPVLIVTFFFVGFPKKTAAELI